MKSTFSIIFYLKRQVVKKDGTVPVMGRITVDGTQAQFSCKTTANPDLWYHQAAVLAHEPSFVRNLGLPLQWSSNRNREFNAWSQGHKDNPGVCQNYQGEIEQRRGKVASAD